MDDNFFWFNFCEIFETEKFTNYGCFQSSTFRKYLAGSIVCAYYGESVDVCLSVLATDTGGSVSDVVS